MELKISPEEWAKCNKQMIQMEELFVESKISFEHFCTIYQAFDRYTGIGYCAQHEKTVEEFNKRGLFHPFNKRELRRFEKRNPQKIEEEIHSFVENKNKYFRKEINGKIVWGIGRAAITLVDEIIYDEQAYRKWNCKGKTFHNFKRMKSHKRNSFDNGIEIMRELRDLYGE